MGYILVDTGEEHFVENGLLVSVDIGLYDDGTDAISETDDLAAITTEPDNANSYARQSTTLTTTEELQTGGDWGVQFTVTFDTSTNSETSIDGSFAVVNFDSDDAGDGGTATDHLHSTHGPFSQERDLSQIDTLDVTITITVS